MNTTSNLPKAINIIVIGNGHYTSGQTILSDTTSTDKDFGVILPTILHLRMLGFVGKICVCGQNGNKFKAVRDKIAKWTTSPGIDVSFESYPPNGEIDCKAYIQALDNTPSPKAAIIAVPDHLHTEMIMACVNRDIPFLIVKPAVTNLNDFYRISTAMPKGMIGMVDYHKVYDDANLLLLQDINNNKYGEVEHISSLMSQRRDMITIFERWLKQSKTFNVNHYLGSHYIHLTWFLTHATPIDVRATQQFGFIKRQFGLNVADAIQTSIRWISTSGSIFSSYHIAGWADPSQSSSMTYQQIRIISEKGNIFSDQRDRGFSSSLDSSGCQIINPYFFNLTPDLLGNWNLETKYGYRSIKTFIQLVINGANSSRDHYLPTFHDSETVTAILEAADLSLADGSAIKTITRSVNGRFDIH